MKVGDTLYHFDINRRHYTKPEGNGRIFGTIIYEKHFQPLKIIGENRVSWLLEYNHKVKKSDVDRKSYYTAQGMADNIWSKEHRYKITRAVEGVDVPTLRKIAELVRFDPNAD